MTSHQTTGGQPLPANRPHALRLVVTALDATPFPPL